jgi:hypothetical protein
VHEHYFAIYDSDKQQSIMYDNMLKIKDYLLDYHEADDGTPISGLEEMFDTALDMTRAARGRNSMFYEVARNALLDLQDVAPYLGVNMVKEWEDIEQFCYAVAWAVATAAYLAYAKEFRKGGKKA